MSRLLLEDLNRVCEIELSAQGENGWKRQFFIDELNNLYSNYWTISIQDQLKQENTIVGFLGSHIVEEEGFITNLAIDPKYQGLGYGKQLLLNFINRLILEKVKFLTLEVRKSNLKAQNLYKKLGFEIKGVRKKYYPDTKEDALIMSIDTIQEANFQAFIKTLKDKFSNKV